MKNKMKKIILFIVFAYFYLLTLAQTSNSILYKSDHWADIKGKGSFAKAMDNPTYEKVEIIKTEKNFKVTFGTKKYNYAIISSKSFSEKKMDFQYLYRCLEFRTTQSMGGSHADV